MKPFAKLALSFAVVIVFAVAGRAQCSRNPSGETAVGMRNASSVYLTFFIDGSNKGGVPAGDQSTAFEVSPGEHTLYAEGRDKDGKVTAGPRKITITSGQVCTWTVT